ncbi:hypothetical protein T440DRAFT_77049 [Plenodomus tracheiphilus IPT5]|uniref:Uncharacterized protein n=1 Tax=Plenodomus tracheiphilus IPT5 TaxID=1408161 RepID=A0A6A7B6U3_9PLEO|nr:hypothetical protein T440DRAFT_77049 [Plenodomus tracheiphilus IPT5]
MSSSPRSDLVQQQQGGSGSPQEDFCPVHMLEGLDCTLWSIDAHPRPSMGPGSYRSPPATSSIRAPLECNSMSPRDHQMDYRSKTSPDADARRPLSQAHRHSSLPPAHHQVAGSLPDASPSTLRSRREMYQHGADQAIVESRPCSSRARNVGKSAPADHAKNRYPSRASSALLRNSQPVHRVKLDGAAPRYFPVVSHQNERLTPTGSDFVLFPQGDTPAVPRSRQAGAPPHHPGMKQSLEARYTMTPLASARYPSDVWCTMTQDSKASESSQQGTEEILLLDPVQTSGPPPTPRSKRLPTPELCDLEESAFCYCFVCDAVEHTCKQCGMEVDSSSC